MDDLYNMDVLSLAAGIENVGRLENPQGTSRKVSKLCGSWLEVDVNMQDGVVIDFALRLQACALGQASAAILSESIIGATKCEIQTARDALFDMLKNKANPPTGRFAKLSLIKDVANYPARHTSTMLVFDAAVEAVEMAV